MNITVDKNQDYHLESQVNGPSGTQLTWYKDNTLFTTQVRQTVNIPKGIEFSR